MSTVVLASAGTGKTWTLVDAWVRAALGLDVDGGATLIAPERLCAITFTEKAAAEMRTRVEQRLTVLRFMPDQEAALRDALIERHGAMPTTTTLDGIRRAVARAPIGTFHALCGRLLREHAIAADLDPAFRILEPDEEQRMLVEIAEGAVLDALAANDSNVADLVARLPLRGLFEQRGFVEGLVDLWGTLAERGTDAVGLAAARPASTVDEALGVVRTAVDALDAAAAAAGKGGAKTAQRVYAAREATTQLVTALALPAVDRLDEVVRAVLALREASAGNWGGTTIAELRRAFVDAVSQLGAAIVDDDVAGLGPTIRDLLVDIDQRQRREKAQRAVLGFGDLLTHCRDLLRDNRSVRARVKSRIARLFVDEYQDTSPVQEQLTALLAEEPTRGDALVPTSPLTSMRIPSGRLFIVGDPKQSIYGFRGADSAVFARAQAAVVDGGGTLTRLTTSRRSTAPVCSFVNLVSATTLPGHEAEALVPLVPVDSVPAVGTWWRAGDAIKAQKLPAVEVEAALVADRIVADVLMHHRPADITILTRRGRSTAVFGRALARRGVPVRVIGGDGFWRRPEILDVVSALSLVVDPRDELAAMTVLRSPLVGVSDDQILALFEGIPSDKGGFTWPRIVAASDDDLVDSEVRDRVRAFDALLTSIRAQLATKPLTHAIDTVVDDGGYAVACAIERDGPQRLRHLEKLRALSAGRPEDGVLGISRLVDAIDDPPAESIVFDAPVGEDAVRIMTVHQSKGLEAEIVILADAGIALRTDSDDVTWDADVGLAVSARGRASFRASPKPSSSAVASTMMQRVRRAKRTRDEAELARLLYVALTRARQRLFVVGEPRRRGPGSMLGLLEMARTSQPEAFEHLLPSEVIDSVDEQRRYRTLQTSETSTETPRTSAPAAVAVAAVPRVRASVLHARAMPQLSIGLIGEAFGEHEDDIIPPRARGRLAHAIIGLVATELPHVLDDRVTASSAARRAEEAIGAPPGAVDDALHDRIVTTLTGPLRRLRDEGRRFSIEVPTVLTLDAAVVEGTADLVADNAHNVIVVEFKLSVGAARSEAALTQVQACCAGLEQQGEQRPLRFACWGIGEAEPPQPQIWGKPARRQLATVIAQLGLGKSVS